MVTLRSALGEANIDFGQPLQRAAMHWRGKLVKRSRWQSRLGEVTRALERDLQSLVSAEVVDGETVMLPWLAESNLVEVRVPYQSEAIGWEARIAPWEFMLSQLRRARDGVSDFAVVRHLARGDARSRPPQRISRVLLVECAPAEVAEKLSFVAERRIVEEAFPGAVMRLESPTREQLERAVVKFAPEVVHVAGVDLREARRILEDVYELDESFSYDGVPLSDGDDWVDPVSAWDFAKCLNAAKTKPRLVFLNLYHSASRISALCVAEGSQYSIGFQDVVDDVLAETLCREFYALWAEAGRLVLPPFTEAIDILRRAPAELTGTGIVLWSSHSLLDDQEQATADWRERWRDQRLAEIDKPEPYDWLEIEVEPHERLNYSLMHNDARGLFSRFAFHRKRADARGKDRRGTLSGVQVNVELHVGADTFPYRTELDLVDPFTAIEDRIKIPLTSDLVRTVQEPLKTSVFAEVRHRERVLHRHTYRVTLLPVDEWRDTDADRLWLPSFVLPRDPAVERIVQAAQAHLMTLADDRNVGFDGYQSVDVRDPDSLGDLDLQVQAIWAALVHRYQVRYINPPPYYTESGQRLRTPTQVLRGRAGTCIDLAILLAACIEYVDIHPVIFLLEGHAFVGYWRSEEYYEEFIGLEPDAGATATGEDERDLSEEGDTPVGSTSQAPWIVPKRAFPEVLRQVSEDRLYPIEAVGLTTHGSFWAAVDEGVENLRDPEEFDSLIDIKQARAHFITPLPIIERRDDGDL